MLCLYFILGLNFSCHSPRLLFLKLCDPNYRKILENFSASFFNPLLSVWILDETLFLVFDILHNA